MHFAWETNEFTCTWSLIVNTMKIKRNRVDHDQEKKKQQPFTNSIRVIKVLPFEDSCVSHTNLSNSLILNSFHFCGCCNWTTNTSKQVNPKQKTKLRQTVLSNPLFIYPCIIQDWWTNSSIQLYVIAFNNQCHGWLILKLIYFCGTV